MNEVSKGIMQGLQEVLDHAQGKIELKSKRVSITPVKEFKPNEIKDIRNNLNMSQGFFAEMLGVSKKTVESWEYGTGKPSGAASRLLSIVMVDPEALRRYDFASW
jgi:putative transcriptional regulator